MDITTVAAGFTAGLMVAYLVATIYFAYRNNEVFRFRGKIIDLCSAWDKCHKDSEESASDWCYSLIPTYEVMVKSFFEPLTLERWIPKPILDRLLDKPKDEDLVTDLRKLAKLYSGLPKDHPDRILFINLKHQMIRRGVRGAIDIDLPEGTEKPQ
jgi:hypothetical protein